MPKFAVKPDVATAVFLEGAGRGEFLIVEDAVTGARHEPQFDVSADPGRYRYVPAAGTGTVVSWAIVHERTADGGVERRPVGIVALDEGPWWWTELVGADPDADLSGLRVEVAFQSFEDGTALPFFRPVADTTGRPPSAARPQ